MGSSRLCQPCDDLCTKWLDSKPSQVLPTFGFAYGSGAAYDVSAAGVRDNTSARYERWRQLVREQMDGIAAACRAAGHATTEPAARVVQLFALAGKD